MAIKSNSDPRLWTSRHSRGQVNAIEVRVFPETIPWSALDEFDFFFKITWCPSHQVWHPSMQICWASNHRFWPTWRKIYMNQIQTSLVPARCLFACSQWSKESEKGAIPQGDFCTSFQIESINLIHLIIFLIELTKGNLEDERRNSIGGFSKGPFVHSQCIPKTAHAISSKGLSLSIVLSKFAHPTPHHTSLQNRASILCKISNQKN